MEPVVVGLCAATLTRSQSTNQSRSLSAHERLALLTSERIGFGADAETLQRLAVQVFVRAGADGGLAVALDVPHHAEAGGDVLEVEIRSLVER